MDRLRRTSAQCGNRGRLQHLRFSECQGLVELDERTGAEPAASANANVRHGSCGAGAAPAVGAAHL